MGRDRARGGNSSALRNVSPEGERGPGARFRVTAERLAHVSWDQLVAETLAIGSPDTVAAKMAEMRDLGVGEVLCSMNFGGLPQDHVRRRWGYSRVRSYRNFG
jgi:alkanesulfonate monooxygenase SsuD/methylene tetrahydromethanopterin reductase-like flavin-dependent oxidoreductase (luciferase family)